MDMDMNQEERCFVEQTTEVVHNTYKWTAWIANQHADISTHFASTYMY
jgi:hypothetical protein